MTGNGKEQQVLCLGMTMELLFELAQNGMITVLMPSHQRHWRVVKGSRWHGISMLQSLAGD